MTLPDDAYSQLAVHHVPAFLKVLLAIAIFFGSVGAGSGLWALYGQEQVAAQRSADQIAAQLASCESGNGVRKAITDYLATFPAGDPSAQRSKDFDTFKKQMAPRDCQRVIVTDPGSSGTTSTTEGAP